MAVRQYVGARYVPQIMGDWNDQTVYEPLSIVHYNFASYTSKKAVPAGVKPTNDEYWALTSQDSAQVEAYRQEVENIAKNVKNNSDSLFYYHTLAIRRNFLFIGDSWGTGYGETTSYINQLLGVYNGRNISKDGAGFAVQGNNFIDLIPADCSGFTDVYMLGGTNDNGKSNESIINGVTACINKVRSSNTSCNIYIGYVGLPEYNYVGGIYNEAVKQTNEYYIGKTKDINYRNDYYTNTNHPNQTLQNILYHGLREFIETGDITTDSEVVTSRLTLAASFTGTSPIIKAQCIGGNKLITIGSMTITSGIKIGENNLGFHNNPLIYQNGFIYWPATVIFNNQGRKITTADITFNRTNMYINVYNSGDYDMTTLISGIVTVCAPISLI